MKVAYAGGGFCGWQKQPNKKTIQGSLEKVLSEILNESIEITGSGRTDTDVSAICQVAHFDTVGVIPKGLVGHVNSKLPDGVRVLDIALAKDNFHARYDAKWKTYKYYFYTSKIDNPYYDKFALHVKYVLNYSTMQTAIKSLNGEHNFTSFCSANTDVKDMVRIIKSATLTKNGELYEFSITGNGFLYNMVRIIVGTLVDIGRGKITISMSEIINKKDRACAGITVPAKGLVLYNVEY